MGSRLIDTNKMASTPCIIPRKLLPTVLTMPRRLPFGPGQPEAGLQQQASELVRMEKVIIWVLDSAGAANPWTFPIRFIRSTVPDRVSCSRTEAEQIECCGWSLVYLHDIGANHVYVTDANVSCSSPTANFRSKYESVYGFLLTLVVDMRTQKRSFPGS